MELLNISPVAILPRTMWVVARAIAATPGLTRNELRDAVCPPTMLPETPQQGAHARVALDALVRFGLVDVDGSDPDSQTLSTVADKDTAAFARRLRRAVLTDSHESESPPEDLLRGIAWLLSQSPTEPLDQRRAESEVSPQFKSPMRWNTFTYWATFLGLGREWPLQTGGLSADPTAAIEDAITHPFGTELEAGRLLELRQLLRHLQIELPIVASGMAGDGGTISSAIAFALRALSSRGRIALERRPDAPSLIGFPAGAGAAEESWFSHVTLRRTA